MTDCSVEKISWRNLQGVFNNDALRFFFENLETKYHVKNENDFFAKLVNMSTANKKSFHRWIRYREGYAGDLVCEILRRFPISPSDYFVMDPMCGSGSSLVACREMGFDALGMDVNGYAVLVTRVKSHSFDSNELNNILNSIIQIKTTPIIYFNTEIEDLDAISKYFPKTNFESLLGLRRWINKEFSPGIVADFFMVALLAILEDCSNRKKDGNGLATRPSPVSNVIERYLNQLDMMLEDISKEKYYDEWKVSSIDCSALELSNSSEQFSKETNKKLGAIIFSPPYANSFDYFESYKLEMIFGGFIKASELRKSRERLIRSYRITKPRDSVHNIYPVEILSAEIMSKVPEKEAETGVRDGRTRLVPNMLRGYFEDMKKVIQEGFNSLDSSGMMHIVVDQSAYVGVPIATDLLFCYLAEQVGFEVISVTQCRRANTSGQQLKKFPYLKDLLRESIVSLRKINFHSP